MKYVRFAGTEAIQMPIVGLGTWRAQPEEVEFAVITALNSGYRHIDTAFNYNNEEAIGNALKSWFESGQGKREDLFITTKLPVFGNRAKDVERYLKMSLEKLQLSYVDLYLIHMPFAFACDESSFSPVVKDDGNYELDYNDNISTWKAMEAQVKAGLIKSIGLSNFNAEQVRNIYNAAEIKPAVLQVELHACLQQRELRQLCQELNIVVTAYAPLGSPGAHTHFQNKYDYSGATAIDILGHPIVDQVAKKHNKTTGQILLRYWVQQDVVVIPKSGNPQRIADNINIFDFKLKPDDVQALNALDKGEAGRIFNFLFFKGVEEHPEYPFKPKA